MLKSNARLDDTVLFDKTISDIINIIVCYDMGWSKRGNGRSFDSLNGYAAIIGFFSGKILDYETRNRKCRSCDQNLDQNKENICCHDCRKNCNTSAGAMEADVGSSLINNSSVLKAMNMKVVSVVGDEDSKLMKKVQENSNDKIFKLCDLNHLKKNFSKEIYKIAPRHKELKSKGVIDHIKKCFSYAQSQNKNNAEQLKVELMNITDHLFNKHENCSSWCKKKIHQIVLTDQSLYDDLLEIFTKYANNAEKFSVAASTQGNEAFHGIVARKLPKNKCLSTSEAADYRVASAVLAKNDGEKAVATITKNKLLLSPGTLTKKYSNVADKKRGRNSLKSKSKSSKIQRNILKEIRNQSRKFHSLEEGVTYESNIGFNLDDKKMEEFNLQKFESELNIQKSLWNKDFDIFYFDLETSSLTANCDILQIALKSGDRIFFTYITPTKQIDPYASKVTGLTVNFNGELLLNNVPVNTMPIKSALKAMYKFLKKCGKKCLLVAHNAKFDVPRFLKAVIKCNLGNSFKKVLYGFSDSLKIKKKKNFQKEKGLENLSWQHYLNSY